MHAIDKILIFTVMLMAIGFTLVVWLYRSPPYPRWARMASLIAGVAGMAWGIITFFQQPFSMQRYPFVVPVSVKQLLGGIFLGIVISVGISRRYDKRAARIKDAGHPEQSEGSHSRSLDHAS